MRTLNFDMSRNTFHPNVINKKNVYKLVYDLNTSKSRSSGKSDRSGFSDDDDEASPSDGQTLGRASSHPHLTNPGTGKKRPPMRNNGQSGVAMASNPSSSGHDGLVGQPGHQIPSGVSLSEHGKGRYATSPASNDSPIFMPGARRPSTIDIHHLTATETTANPPNARKETDGAVNVPSGRQRLAFYLDTSHTGRFLELGDAILSLAQCLLYIFNTLYVAPPSEDGVLSSPSISAASSSMSNPVYGPATRRAKAIPLPEVNRDLELGIAFMIFAMFIFRLFIAPSRSYFISSNYALLTLISAVPVFAAHVMASIDETIYLSYMSAGVLVYVYPFRWARLHEAICVVLMPVKDPIIRVSPVARKAFNVTCAILLTLLSVSAFIHIAAYKDARNTKDSSFFDVFYFTVMSSTSGLNNTTIQADSWFTRALLLYILIAGAFYIPTHLSELLTMIRSRSKFTKPYANDTKQSHVIVTGTFEATSMMEFLREFFCPDHGPSTINTFVVMLHPSEPSEELVAVLQDPAYMARTRYIKGSATSFRALSMACAKQAKAIFIMANKLSSESGDKMFEDAETVMRALAIKKYNPSVPIFVESMLPENQAQFHYLSDEILCLQELTLGILSQSCRVPGFCTLVSLLSTSLTEQTRCALVKQADRESASFLKPYIHGASQEIYGCRFPCTLIGKSFRDVTRILYCEFGACLIALGVHVNREELPPSLRFHIVLNPADYIITGSEIGFLIGEESEVVESILDFNGEIMGGESDNPNADATDEDSPLLRSFQPRVFKVNVPDLTADDDVPYEDDFEPDMSVNVSMDTLKDTEEKPASVVEEMKRNLSQPEAERSPENRGTAVLLQTGGPVVLEDDLSTGERELDPSVCNHIILCDAGPGSTLPAHLHLFFQPIRDPLIAKQPPVVILAPLDPPESVFAFVDVYFVRGSPHRRADLVRAGVERAKKLVIMCGIKSSMRTADAGAILCALNAESAAKGNLYPVIEFVHKENFKFISDTEVLRCIEDPFSQVILRPSFMAGHVFSPTLLDGILAQCYYSSHIMSLLKRLIFTCRPSLLEKLMISEEQERRRLGENIVNSLKNWKKGKGKKLFNSWIARESTTDPIGEGSSLSGVSPLPIQRTCLHQLDVPPIFVGRHYKRLYSYLANQGMVIMGLYRRVQSLDGRHPLCMTIINPRPMVQLRPTDKIFVLCNEAM